MAFTGTLGAVELGSWIWKVTLVMCPLLPGAPSTGSHLGTQPLPCVLGGWLAVRGLLELEFLLPSAGQGSGYRQEAAEVSGTGVDVPLRSLWGASWSSSVGGAGLPSQRLRIIQVDAVCWQLG